MLAREVNDLHQWTLDIQLEGVLIYSLRHAGHARDLFEPRYRGRTRKADLDIVLADLFERGNVVDFDQPPFANDRYTVARVLNLWQDVRGEEDRPSLSVTSATM